MSKVRYFKTQSDLLQHITSKAIITKDIHFINDELARVTFIYEDGYEPPSSAVNVTISAYVTAYARIRLYKILESLQERAVYFDTDSIIAIEPKNQEDRIIKLGKGLGDLVNEIDPDPTAISFISGGPKCYALKTCSGRVKLVVKGLNMNRFSNELTYDKFKDMVLEQCRAVPSKSGGLTYQSESCKIHLTEPDKMWADSIKGAIKVKPLQKVFRTNYTKRRLVIDENGFFTRSLPFGYAE